MKSKEEICLRKIQSWERLERVYMLRRKPIKRENMKMQTREKIQLRKYERSEPE
jgi:hypothetical protein